MLWTLRKVKRSLAKVARRLRAQTFSLLTRLTWRLLSGQTIGVMEADTLKMRGKRPFVFSNLKTGEGVEPTANFVIEQGGLVRKDR
jgi:hypothetical protein